MTISREDLHAWIEALPDNQLEQVTALLDAVLAVEGAA